MPDRTIYGIPKKIGSREFANFTKFSHRDVKKRQAKKRQALEGPETCKNNHCGGGAVIPED